MKNCFSNLLILAISLIISSVLGCSSLNQRTSKDLTLANKLINKPKTVDEENFAKQWESKFNETAAELERNRSLWKQNKIVDYNFVISKSAHGNSDKWTRLPVLIKVRSDEKISIEKVEKDKDYVIYSRTDGFEDFDTINKLFNYLRHELEKGRILGVDYHKGLGYPKTVVILDSPNTHGNIIFVEKVEIIKNI